MTTAPAADVERLLADMDRCICAFGAPAGRGPAHDAGRRAADETTLRSVPRLTGAAVTLAAIASPQDRARIVGRVETLARAVDARMQAVQAHLAQLAAGRRAVRGYTPSEGRR